MTQEQLEKGNEIRKQIEACEYIIMRSKDPTYKFAVVKDGDILEYFPEQGWQENGQPCYPYNEIAKIIEKVKEQLETDFENL